MTALLLTADPGLHLEVTRLAAAAGVHPVVVDTAGEAVGDWASADVVLVGADLVGELALLAPARRGRVWVVSVGVPVDGLFRSALGVGAESVLMLPASEAWLVEVLGDAGETEARGRVVGVVGGSGGAGATTLACALAQAGALSAPTLLVDADTRGPGLDRMFGLEAEQGVRWHDLDRSPGRLGARALREGVPRVGDLGVLTWSAVPGDPPRDQVVRETVAAAGRGHQLVVVDLPRHGSRMSTELAARCEQVLVVCPATLTAVAATVKVVAVLDLPTERLGLVLRPGGLRAADVEAATGLPVLVQLGRQRGLAEAVDLGLGPLRSRRGPLSRAVRAVLAEAA